MGRINISVLIVTMRKQFFIHGKPSEGELLSTNLFDGLEERIYKEFFGSSTKPACSPCLVYEIRRWKDVTYSVYSYYRNGKDSFGAGNGYCVLTLIVEGYYSKKCSAIYSLLESVYKDKIQNEFKIIDGSGNYLVRSFKEKGEQLYNIKDIVISHLEEDSLYSIERDYSSIKTTETPECVNLKDVDNNDFYDILLRDGKVFVSSSYKTVAQKREELRIKEEQKLQQNRQKNDHVPTKVTQPKNNANKISSQKQEDDALKIVLNKLEELMSMKTANMAGGFQQDVDNSTNTIVEDIKTSVRTSSPFAWFSVVNCLLLCLCIILLYSNNTQAVQDINVDDITETEVNHDAELKLSESKIDSLNMLVATFRTFANAKIDIKNIKKGAIARDTPCKVSIVDVEGIDQKKGLFIIEGNSAKIEGDQLTGTEKGTVDLVFIYNGVEVKRRTVNVN